MCLAGCRAATFFTREAQSLQLAAHRAGTNLHARAASHASTQFTERHVRLFLDFRPQEGGMPQQGPLRTVRLWPRGAFARLPLSV